MYFYLDQAEGYYPGVWNIGDVGSYEYQKTSTREECAQICWQKFVAGVFYVGVQRRIPSIECYCITTSMGSTPTSNTNWEFLPFLCKYLLKANLLSVAKTRWLNILH